VAVIRGVAAPDVAKPDTAAAPPAERAPGAPPAEAPPPVASAAPPTTVLRDTATAVPARTTTPSPSAAPVPTLFAANGLPMPPPEKPPVPVRCPPLDPLALSEATPLGRLPRIDANGCLPWLAHAAAVDPREARPRIGIVVLGLGRGAVVTQRAIEELPASVTLGFMPDSPYLDRWIERARARGHEVLLILPVQGTDTTLPALRADAPAAENLRRLQGALGRAAGYAGVVMPATSPLGASDAALRPLLQDVADRGLLLLEVARAGAAIEQLGAEMGLPYRADAGALDRDPARADMASKLRSLESLARLDGATVATATASRESIEQLVAWAKEVESRGLALAPVSALVACGGLCDERRRKAMALSAR
jgi:hypothetical protein